MFTFFLAEKLGMTVARLVDETSNAEFVRWSRYFGIKAQQRQLDNLKAGG